MSVGSRYTLYGKFYLLHGGYIKEGAGAALWKIHWTLAKIFILFFRRASHSYGQTKKLEKPKVPRFMRKNGHCNIRQAAQDKREKYMSDLFTTFVDLARVEK